MKTIITFLLVVWTTIAFAQPHMFVHTANAGNIASAVTYIDHPGLNNNPTAKILVTHNWNPSNGTGVYNDKKTGAFYSTTQNKWCVFNEDNSAMQPDVSFNIYIAQGTEAFTHISNAGNQGTSTAYTILNDPALNGNPNATALLTTYWNANGVYNDHNYGFWYDDTPGTDHWIIYAEDLTAIPTDAAFFVVVEGEGVQSMRHEADAGNISANWTMISHPLLDGDPNAVFVATHNWGVTGDTSNVVLDKTFGVWYTGTNWAIYTEDQSAMPVGATFDLLIYDPTLSTEDVVIEGFDYYPNPVNDMVMFKAEAPVSRVTVFNVLGQQILDIEGDNTKMVVDLSGQTSGTYFANVAVGEAVKTVKLVKL
ncbi:T9SS type A sorting domain-containing protein [Altibacter sp.]|uniref:DUF7452 domain-containing protein n=1 Tax=Altibacter sp. TaxID=2024823 RepID=UPI00258F6A6E|nr:T9SS type A sorting domain-containing protein [Altibacter sp.]MCW9036526.1 T9SS type A sorting domain-containing protein [Altibacter sp.]